MIHNVSQGVVQHLWNDTLKDKLIDRQNMWVLHQTEPGDNDI